jgi:hypothetical protein
VDAELPELIRLMAYHQIVEEEEEKAIKKAQSKQ